MQRQTIASSGVKQACVTRWTASLNAIGTRDVSVVHVLDASPRLHTLWTTHVAFAGRWAERGFRWRGIGRPPWIHHAAHITLRQAHAAIQSAVGGVPVDPNEMRAALGVHVGRTRRRTLRLDRRRIRVGLDRAGVRRTRLRGGAAARVGRRRNLTRARERQDQEEEGAHTCQRTDHCQQASKWVPGGRGIGAALDPSQSGGAVPAFQARACAACSGTARRPSRDPCRRGRPPGTR